MEANSLQNDIAIGIGEDLFFNTVTAIQRSVHQFVGGNARLNGQVFETAVPLFLREKTAAVGDDQAQITGAGLVYSWIINLIQNAMTDGEPHPAVQGQRSSNSGFGARCPAWRNSGPAGSKAFLRITHLFAILPSAVLTNCRQLQDRYLTPTVYSRI